MSVTVTLQRLKSAFPVPVLAGRRVPAMVPLRRDLPAWRSQAATFAVYWLSLLLPWEMPSVEDVEEVPYGPENLSFDYLCL